MPSRELKKRVVGAFADVAGEADEVGTLFDTTGRGQLRRLPLNQVHPRPDQPRTSMDPEALEELAASIREHGVLQPIRVRPRAGGGYEIIAGERRWRAAQLAGLRDIAAVIATSDDDEAYVEALIENIQREDLNPVDRAQALKRLRVNLARRGTPPPVPSRAGSPAPPGQRGGPSVRVIELVCCCPEVSVQPSWIV